jgi:hypothetical protein
MKIVSNISCKFVVNSLLLIKDESEGDHDMTNNFQFQELPTRTILSPYSCLRDEYQSTWDSK